jgi:1-acyl-sn-glycerol-3-phosphate acyltransferase
MMLFLKSLLFFIGSFIVLVVVAIGSFFTLPLSYNNRYAWISKWAKFNIWWLRISCNLKTNIIGKQNIPKSTSVIISNHQSAWDVFIFQTIFPPQTWVLKKELLFIPIFGWGLAMLRPVTINRKEKLKAIKKVIKQGSAIIKKGIFLIIFPEGTRRPYGKLGKYQNGGVSIAKKAKCGITPIYHNSGKFWPNGKFIKKPGTITLVIGKTIIVDNQSPTELNAQIIKWTEQQQQKFN